MHIIIQRLDATLHIKTGLLTGSRTPDPAKICGQE